MKKIGLKILGLIIIVLVVNQLFYKCFIQPRTTFSWGYDGIHAKQNYLKVHQSDFNTLFIGSSAIFRHIDPNVFDANCDDSLSIKSFNFGIPAMFPMQAAYTYENLLEYDHPKLKYVFMDLFEVGNMFLALNAPKKRTHYWYNFASYKEALKITSKYDSPSYVKANAYFGYSLAYLAKLFNAEIIEEVLLCEKERAPSDFPFLVDNRNGFYSLDQEYEDTKDESKEMESRREMFLKDTLQNVALQFNSKEFFTNYDQVENYKVNELHLEKINQLIELSKENGIHLMFILHPRLYKYEYKMIMPIYDKIDNQHKINLNDSRTFPQFYQAKYTFDPLHLNEAGAKIFSQSLAEEFNQIIKE